MDVVVKMVVGGGLGGEGERGRERKMALRVRGWRGNRCGRDGNGDRGIECRKRRRCSLNGGRA